LVSSNYSKTKYQNNYRNTLIILKAKAKS